MKKLLSLIIAAALVISLMPTIAFAAVGDEFSVNFYDWEGYTSNNQYFSDTTKGNGWAVDAENSDERQISGTKEGGAARLQVQNADMTGFKFLTVGQASGDLAIKFNAPKAGTYSIKSIAIPYASNGKVTEVYVNGAKVGSFNSYSAEGNPTLAVTRVEELGTVYLKEGEYANSLVIRCTDGQAFLEGFTFTEVETVPTAVNFNFYNSLAVKPSNSDPEEDRLAPADTTGENFITIVEESNSNQTGDHRVYTAGGISYPQFEFGKGGSSTWISSGNDASRKWTFKLPITAAGWYNVDFLGAYWFANDIFYVYVDDQFAGIYDFNNGLVRAVDSAIYLGDKKSLNTLYLTPDEDGYVKIMLAYAKNCGYGQARIAPIELNLIPTESQEKVKCVDIVHTLPETLEYGEVADFTAYALMSDGTTRHINGYKSDATADDGNAISVTGEGNHFLIERKSDPLYDDGIYSGQIKAEGVGEEKITLFVNVDGEPFSKEVTVTATPASEPVAFSMSLADDGLVYADSSKATDWKSVGYSVVLDKTATVASRYYSRGEYAVTQLTTASGRQVWPHLTTDSQMTMITFKKSVPAAGYYDISFTGYLWKSSSDYDIYINEEYAGQTNCYDATDELSGKTATSNLNTLYLPAGDIEISFRAKNSHYTGAMFFTPKSLNFAPSAVSEIAISAVETSEIPVTMEAGTTYDGTAKALMNSGDYRSFGHMNNGTIPTSDDVIRVSSSNPAVVAVTDVVCVKRVTDAENKDSAFTIDPQTTTYKLNALRAGKAEITVTAIVDGKEKSTTTEVVVSGDAKEATITKNTASVSILALDGGSVKTDISIVDEVEFGEGVEAEAIADSGYKFAYWTDSNGRVLSDKAKETFIINTNTSIKAYFEKIVADDAETVPVYFYNGNGSLFKSGVATKGSVFADLKGDDEPSLTGFKFDKWSVADNAIINNVTRAVALFTDMPNTYTVSVDDGIYSTSYSGKKYGDKITVTAKGSDTFSCWMMGDDIVCYDKSFTFSVYGDMKLTAVYGAALTAAPVAAFEEVGGSYFLTYSVPAGYEKIEAGIIFSEGGTPTVGSAYSKAIERTGSGQFTAQPNGEEDVVARGYVMFRDRDNNIKVIYAD